MAQKINMKYMCDHCYRLLGSNEQMVAIKVVDDFNQERVFKGHSYCLDEIMETLANLYGKQESDNE